jgi:hypothetical protein
MASWARRRRRRRRGVTGCQLGFFLFFLFLFKFSVSGSCTLRRARGTVNSAQSNDIRQPGVLRVQVPTARASPPAKSPNRQTPGSNLGPREWECTHIHTRPQGHPGSTSMPPSQAGKKKRGYRVTGLWQQLVGLWLGAARELASGSMED